ncbi:TIGR03364 family FAD-dependent oxidoreductase [Nocardia huaxiensis]|uniref:TIGR03364 family FAD-dependent oxidoreductase n=1 Tax=Nocardia huaxiensis TaxID=2755382 RepID=A0A7D6ZFP2_9NOCA|nr:TIGR03364 family FAD-dependent oxidoreductase [Nocardia huaxiensis]QLY29799.1 TIGR03364 family FAD-dependent oxidoreductase [Nocardia huaxiensis]
MRLVIIGGGILGTAHALAAIGRGHDVVHLEREAEARGATVRNFGLVWVSGRSATELEITLRSRQLWEEIGGKVPGVGFRPAGSMTLVRTEAELAVAEAAVRSASAAERGFELLDPERVRAINPALRGKFLAGLHCSKDAAVESRQALPALRRYMEATGRYTFFAGTEARTITGTAVFDDHGRRHDGDLVLVCPGAAHAGFTRELVGELPVRRVRLQMMQTAPLGEPLTTAVADGDSFRYYPAFRGAELDRLNLEEAQPFTAAQHKMQLLCVQRLHGGLTIGDTHEYDEPFNFDVDEAPYEHLTAVAEELLGRKLPTVVRRWAGVYSQSIDPGAIVTRAQAADNVWVITGPGGRGMTLGPALGEETADLLSL